MLYGNANDKDLLKRQQMLQASQPMTLTQTQQNVKQIGEQPTVTPSRSDYGGSYWDQMYFTDDELRNSHNTRNAAQNGDITWDDAHSYVENIRKKYGYSGGDDGSRYIALPAVGDIRMDTVENTVSDITNNMAVYEQYLSPIKAEIDAKTAAIANRQPFSYDPATDPVYQAYQKQYAREGARATADTLGQYAAMTGGMPSTAAVTAAQQAGDYYAAQMSDKIPELYKLAYSMYADEADRDRSDLSSLMSLDNNYYGRYLDRWGMLGDLYSMASGERSYADSRADKEAADAYNYAMATGDYSYLRDLGYDTSFLEKQRDKEMAELDKPELSLAEVNAAIKAGNTAPNVLKAWEYYYGAPYSGATDTPYTDPYSLIPVDDGDDNAVGAGGSDAEIISPPLIGYQNRDLYKEFAGQGVSDGTVSSPGQLSPAAQRIENTIASFAMGGNTKDAQLYAADAVTEALQNGEITPEEAEYFANMFGF